MKIARTPGEIEEMMNHVVSDHPLKYVLWNICYQLASIAKQMRDKERGKANS